MAHGPIDITRHVLGKHGFDYSRIDDDVYIGTNMCCQYGFHHELLEKNVRADISLEDERVDSPRGVDYFLWLPTTEGEPPPPDQLELGVRTLEFFAERRTRVYVHCKKGHGRAPTLFAAYLIRRKGMSPEQAVAYLKQRRSVVHLTAAQEEGLRKFATSS